MATVVIAGDVSGDFGVEVGQHYLDIISVVVV
jgi:hypothetical protein